MRLLSQIKPLVRCKNSYCKICFNEIKDNSFYSLVHKNNLLCEDCFAKFTPKFIHFEIENCRGLAIYEYDQTIKDILFKFKGCFDYELKDTFLDRFINYLKVRYSGYLLVPIPSYYLDDQTRGFNHVKEIYNRLKLPVLNIIEKTKKEKQANKKKKERMKVGNIFAVHDLEQVKNKKILIVDDVMTTGSSLSAAIKLVKGGNPKRIEVLVVAKNVEKTHK